MDDVIAKLKVQMIEALNLEDTVPEDIDPDEPLFGEGLGLDSIDALELAVLMEREYQIQIPDAKVGKQIFASVKTMADYIKEQHSH